MSITSHDWTGLAEVQRRKSHLQTTLDETQSGSADGVCSTPRNAIRSTIEQLMRFERSNLALLSQRMDAARTERESTRQSVSNLRRLHRYATPSAMVAWQSYS